MPKTTFQLVDISIDVEADVDVLRFFSRYVSLASHASPPKRKISLRVESGGGSYRLPSGASEISPEVCAEKLWLEIEETIRDLLRDWLQLGGVCIGSDSGWVLVTSDNKPSLRLAAVEAMAAALDVASVMGICIKGGAALPYALPLHMMLREFRQADPAGLRFPDIDVFHDEQGSGRCRISPPYFGKKWHVSDMPLRHVVALDWNEAGLTRFRPVAPPWRLELLLDAAHMPDSLKPDERLGLIMQARTIANDIAFSRLQLGRLSDFPSALSSCLAFTQAHV